MGVCDFNRISGLILGAQVGFIGALGICAAAVILGSNPFTSAANIPAMIIAASLAGAATIALGAALASLNDCAAGPCGAEVTVLRTNLIALIASFGTFTVMLAALAVIAGFPWVGSAAAAALCIWALSLSAMFGVVADGYLGNAIQSFNACMQRSNQGNNTTTAVIVASTVVVVLLGVVFGSVGVYTHAIPVPPLAGQ
jgi:hypothetical protein